MFGFPFRAWGWNGYSLAAEMCTVWLLELGQNVFIFCCWNLGLECMVLPLEFGTEIGSWGAEIALSPLEF